MSILYPDLIKRENPLDWENGQVVETESGYNVYGLVSEVPERLLQFDKAGRQLNDDGSIKPDPYYWAEFEQP